MATDNIWLNANPELSIYHHRAHAARAAAFDAAFKAIGQAVGGALRSIAAHLAHARRENETYHALRDLSDHQLRDIGLNRGEILGVAREVADRAGGGEVTLAELRGLPRAAPAERNDRVIRFDAPGVSGNARRDRPVQTAGRATPRPAARKAAV